MSKDLNLKVILASVRQARFGEVVTRWFVDEASHDDRFANEVIDLAEVPLPLVLGPEPPAIATEDPRPPEMVRFTQRLDDADAFVIVTPEYNRSFPASIKSLIDWHFTQWQGKPVGFVSYGGPAGGLRAVEQLRLVFAEMHAVTVRNSVSFVNYWELFDTDGRPSDRDGSAQAAQSLLDQLAWWGGALRQARLETPYAAVAA